MNAAKEAMTTDEQKTGKCTNKWRAGGATPHPHPEARGSGREDQPHFPGAMAAWAQEGLEELSHVEGQEGRQ